MPIITIPIEEEYAIEIHSLLFCQKFTEVEMKEEMRRMEALGFNFCGPQ